MDVKVVLEEVDRTSAKNASVHVLTDDEPQAEAVVAEAKARWGAEAVLHLKRANTIPETRVVVGRWVEFCFAYARQGQAFLGPAAEDHLADQDRQLAGASAVIVGVSEDERRTPCTISKEEEGETRILASVSFSDLSTKYAHTVEMPA